MPHVPTMLPADRFFARLDRFECECPSCGNLILSSFDERSGPARLQSIGQRRGAARRTPHNVSVKALVWNPLSQRLACPFCGKSYYAGLVLYPAPPSRPQAIAPPADAIPTRRQLAELRRRTGGWWAEQAYKPGEPVNLIIDSPCICPPKGWAVVCPVHGDPAHGAKLQPTE